MDRMSKGSFGNRISMGRPSLTAEPLRVRNNMEDNVRHSSTNDIGRPSLGNAAGARKKSFLPKPPTGPGLSSASKRQSSGYGRGVRRTDLTKDPRPTSDKGYQHRCIKRLVEFLLENGYRHAVSTKLLQSPQSKDFLRIFEFLYSHFDQKYKIGPKPEEQIPVLLKTMGYPYNITKSALFTIGTPHTWPHLLATLIWLVDLIQTTQSITDVDSTMFQQEEEGMPINRIMFNYVASTYAGFMQGKDTYEEEDEELDVLLKANLGAAEDLEKISAEHERLSQELQCLEQNPDKETNLKENIEILLADDQMYVKYLSDLEAHFKDQEQLTQETQEEQLALLSELQASEDNNEHQKKDLENQEFSATDVDRIRQTCMENQRQIDSVEKEIQSTDSDVWALEMEMGKKQEQVEAVCRGYNKLAQKHKLIPSNADYANGKDLEMRPTFTMGTSRYNIIKPVLQDFKLEFKGKATKKAQSRIASIDSLEEMSEQLAQKQEDLSLKESKLRRVEEDLNCKKEMSQKEWSSYMKKTEDLQTGLSQLRKEERSSVEELKLVVQQTNKQLEEQVFAFKKKEDEYCNFLTEYTKIVLEHKQSISSGIEQVYFEILGYCRKLEANPHKLLFAEITTE